MQPYLVGFGLPILSVLNNPHSCCNEATPATTTRPPPGIDMGRWQSREGLVFAVTRAARVGRDQSVVIGGVFGKAADDGAGRAL